MLNLPTSTVVDRKIPKEKFYSHADLNSKQRAQIIERIDTIYWRYKIAPNTLNIRASETIKEIQIFEIILRQKSLTADILSAFANSIPYPILFAQTFDNQTSYAMLHKGTLYKNSKLYSNNTPPALIGSSLDSIHQNFIRQLAGLPINSTPLDLALSKKQEREKLQKEIDALENTIATECQPRRKWDAFEKLKQLKNQLEKLFL